MDVRLPYLAHPRSTTLKPLRQVDAIAQRRGCSAVAQSVPLGPGHDHIGTPPPKPRACSPALGSVRFWLSAVEKWRLRQRAGLVRGLLTGGYHLARRDLDRGLRLKLGQILASSGNGLGRLCASGATATQHRPKHAVLSRPASSKPNLGGHPRSQARSSPEPSPRRRPTPSHRDDAGPDRGRSCGAAPGAELAPRRGAGTRVLHWARGWPLFATVTGGSIWV
jgi:hypothetical protein